MKTRVNNTNRPLISAYIKRRFNAKSRNRADGRQDYLSIIDIWDVQFEIEKKWNITDQASQKISWEVVNGVTA
jgi:hypothetical protein